MNEPIATKDKLLSAARDLFWTRGYSNVSVRQITSVAGVDVALVSRYFGSKQGLFEATLESIPPWDALLAEPEDLLDRVVDSFSQPFDAKNEKANPFTLLVANVIDPEMGDTVRLLVQDGLATPLAEKIGGEKAEERAAMLLAALFGMALMRKAFQVRPLANAPLADLRAQVMHLADAALRFED